MVVRLPHPGTPKAGSTLWHTCRKITCTYLTVKQDNEYEQLALSPSSPNGGGKLAPENTAAIDVGARYATMIEFDAKLSRRRIFLLHDDNLERTSNGWGVAGNCRGAIC